MKTGVLNMLTIKKASQMEIIASKDEWLIEGVIPSKSLCLLGAAPKQGKTMIALELSTALCSGKPAFDKHLIPKKGRVLYFAGEDSETGLKRRIEAFADAKKTSVNDMELYAITGQPLLIDDAKGREVLHAAILGYKPDLLVLDNLSRIHRSNENNATNMAHLFEFLQEIKNKYDTSILLICHLGKNGTLRGSSQIDSYYESAMFLKSKNGQRYVDFKFRNYEERLDVPYQLVAKNGLRIKLDSAEVTPITIVNSLTEEQALATGRYIRTQSGGIMRIA